MELVFCQKVTKMYFPTIKDDIHSAVLAREVSLFLAKLGSLALW